MQVPEDKDFQSLTEGIWQWESNPDPWSISEEPQWESYSPELNLLLEEAYFDQRKQLDIGDWIVSLEHMLQINKQDNAQQRPVRRIDWMEDEESNSRSTRYCNMESLKPTNSVFGDLEDFLNYFSKRSPEIWDFAKLFKEIEKSKNLNELNQKICPAIKNCIIKEFTKLIPEKQEMIPLSKDQQKERKMKEKLLSSFRKDFKSFEDFFGEILRVYTMNSFLYRNLNQYLRDENWAEINDILPYAFCLCRAFPNTNPNSSKKIDQMTTLYRGTMMSEEAVQHFHTATVRDFSWFAVTSTTRNRKVAEKFIKKKKNQEKKCRVIFIIQMDYWRSYIDVSKYSAYPKEEEVLLPPGSLFEILQITKDGDEITIINLKLKELGKFVASDKIAHGELIMPGAVQSEIMNDRETKIVSLGGEELCAVLKTAHGNTLLQEIEFYLCSFDHKSLQEMTKVLQSMKGLKVVKLVLCLCQVEGQILKTEDFPNFAVQIYEICNFSQVFGICKHWASLKSLSMVFKNMTDQGIDSLCAEAIQYLTDLTTLSLDFSNCSEITDEGVQNLCSEGLKYLSKLENLSLNFSSCNKITKKGVNSLFSEGLRHLSDLKLLTLDFSFCDFLAEKILSRENLDHLTGLKVNLKTFNTRLEPFVFTTRRFFGLVSGDGKVAQENFQRPLSGQSFQKIITDLILRADSESSSYQSFQEALKNYALIPSSSNSTRNNRTSFHGTKVSKDLTTNYSTFEELLSKIAARISDRNSKDLEPQTCVMSLNLHSYPSWMRDKAIDYLILEELEHYIQEMSKDFDCSESTVVEIFLKPWFEEISNHDFERSFSCSALIPQISPELSRKENNIPMKRRLLPCKNTQIIRFAEKTQKASIFPKRHKGNPFS